MLTTALSLRLYESFVKEMFQTVKIYEDNKVLKPICILSFTFDQRLEL